MLPRRGVRESAGRSARPARGHFRSALSPSWAGSVGTDTFSWCAA